VNILQRIAFDVTRKLLITLTGSGADRSKLMNNFHHKLSYRLHRKLSLFGLSGETRVTLTGLPGRTLRMRAEDGGVAHQFLVYGRYEPFESGLVMRMILPGMTVLNVGANIGYYTLLASIASGELGRVIAFEPSRENFELLCKNIADNHLRNVLARNAAVAEVKGILNLFLSSSNSGDHQIYSGQGETRTAQEVDAVTLDEFCLDEGLMPDVLIIDVQGAEFKVLQGLSNYLRADTRKPIVMLMEFGPRNLRQAGDSPEALLAFLNDLGLEMLVIDEAQKRLYRMTAGELLASTYGYAEKNLLVYDKREREPLLSRLAQSIPD